MMNHDVLESLVARGSEGDQEAFAGLYEYIFERFFHVALKLVKSPEDAADVMQEVAIQVYRRLHTLESEKAFVTFVNRIVYGKCVDFLRAEQKWHRAAEVDVPETETRWEFIPEAKLEQAELRAQVLEQIDNLSENLRMIVLLYYYEQLSTAEIARVLDLKENTVRVRLSRARKQLRQNIVGEKKRKHRGVLMLGLGLFFLRSSQAQAICKETWTAICGDLSLPLQELPQGAKHTQSVPLFGGKFLAVGVTAVAAVIILGGMGALKTEKLTPSYVPPHGMAVQTAPPDSVDIPQNQAETNGKPEDEVPAPQGHQPLNDASNTAEPDLSEDGRPAEELTSIPNTQAPEGELPVQQSELSPLLPKGEIPADNDDRLLTLKPDEENAPSPGQEHEEAYASLAIAVEHLRYSLNAVLNSSVILADSGAVGSNLTKPLQVVGLNQISQGSSGTYFLYIRLDEEKVHGERQRLITVELTNPPSPLVHVWSDGTNRSEQPFPGGEDYRLTWQSILRIPHSALSGGEVWSQAAASVEPLVYNRLDTPLPMDMHLSCADFAQRVNPQQVGSYFVEVAAQIHWQGQMYIQYLPITILVEDETPPVITAPSSPVLLQRGQAPASLAALLTQSGCSAQDAVSGAISLQAELFDMTFSQIDWTQAGEYGIYLTAADEAGNKGTRTIVLKIL